MQSKLLKTCVGDSEGLRRSIAPAKPACTTMGRAVWAWVWACLPLWG